MQKVEKGGVIKLTRGDTGYFHFPDRVDGEIAAADMVEWGE